MKFKIFLSTGLGDMVNLNYVNFWVFVANKKTLPDQKISYLWHDTVEFSDNVATIFTKNRIPLNTQVVLPYSGYFVIPSEKSDYGFCYQAYQFAFHRGEKNQFDEIWLISRQYPPEFVADMVRNQIGIDHTVLAIRADFE